MKEILNYQEQEIVNIYDEVNLWTAPFGRLLLENIPMQKGMTVVDVGFGTGFPLVELSQRFGTDSKIYGIDIWEGGIKRTKEKIKTLELRNIEILEESATSIKLPRESVDLITSNLGVNNFSERRQVYQELYRILRQGGSVAITTNPIGTFKELFVLFEEVLKDLGQYNSIVQLDTYIANRNTESQIIKEFEASDFKFKQKVEDHTNIRFLSAESLLNHGLIRIGFREGWENFLKEIEPSIFYKKLSLKIDALIKSHGEFKMSIPLLYLEFQK